MKEKFTIVVRVLLVLWGAVLDVLIALNQLTQTRCPTEAFGQTGCSCLHDRFFGWFCLMVGVARAGAGLRHKQSAAWLAGYLSIWFEIAFSLSIEHSYGGPAGFTTGPLIVLIPMNIFMLIAWPEEFKLGSLPRECSKKTDDAGDEEHAMETNMASRDGTKM